MDSGGNVRFEERSDTVVTGSPRFGSGAMHPGEVLRRRYEIVERVYEDGFSSELRGLDHETEQFVLLRIVRSELLTPGERDEVVRRLQRAVGIGGRFLPGLIDADKEGPNIFTVEPFSTGVPFRDVIDARVSRGAAFRMQELLPLVARLSAALAAIPPPWRHGDLRAERIWIDPARLQLTGPFLLTAMPPAAVASVLRANESLRRRFAPEVLHGAARDAADRYGVALIVCEALTGVLPRSPLAGLEQLEGTRVGEALRALLNPNPTLRPSSLDPLIEALANEVDLPVPRIEPGAFRRPRRVTSRSGPMPKASIPPEERTVETPMSPSDMVPADPTRRVTSISTADTNVVLDPSLDTGDTRQVAMPPHEQGVGIGSDRPSAPPFRKHMFQELAARDTWPVPSDGASTDPSTRLPERELFDEGPTDLSPRLPERDSTLDAVSTKLSSLPPSERFIEGPTIPTAVAKLSSPSDLDPRLVRAALGISLEEQHMGENGRTLEDDRRPIHEELESRVRMSTARQTSGIVPKLVRPPEPPPQAQWTLPDGIKPIPKPRLAETEETVLPDGERVVLFDDSMGFWDHPAPENVAVEVAPSVSRNDGEDTIVPSESFERSPRSSESAIIAPGRWMIPVAVLLALIIIAAGMMVYLYRSAAIERESDRRLQERFLQIKGNNNPIIH